MQALALAGLRRAPRAPRAAGGAYARRALVSLALLYAQQYARRVGGLYAVNFLGGGLRRSSYF
jgi:hypothetical protein